MNKPISHYLNKNKSDKCYSHTYQIVYDSFFSSQNKNDALEILEVGVEKGGSLLAWKEFFPNATVTGVDITDTREYKSDDTTFVLSDIKEYKTDKLFDFIIDDGSHSNSDGMWSIVNLSKKLKNGGTLFIEDVQEGFMLAFLSWGQLNGKYVLSAVDMRRLTNKHDNFMLIIQKCL